MELQETIKVLDSKRWGVTKVKQMNGLINGKIDWCVAFDQLPSTMVT